MSVRYVWGTKSVTNKLTYPNVSSNDRDAYLDNKTKFIEEYGTEIQYTYKGEDIIDPKSINYPVKNIRIGDNIKISIIESDSIIFDETSLLNCYIRYRYQYQINQDEWKDIGISRKNYIDFIIPEDKDIITICFRVQASDNTGFVSNDYITGKMININSSMGYVGINGKAQELVKGYVGIDGKAREIIKGYVGVNGKAQRIF